MIREAVAIAEQYLKDCDFAGSSLRSKSLDVSATQVSTEPEAVCCFPCLLFEQREMRSTCCERLYLDASSSYGHFYIVLSSSLTNDWSHQYVK